MIEGIEIIAGCDRHPTCEPLKVHQTGPEIDYDSLEERLETEGWLVENDGEEYICPACASFYEAEQRELQREAERDAILDDPRRGQAADINRMSGSY